MLIEALLGPNKRCSNAEIAFQIPVTGSEITM
jgi:hypothetical protein